MGKMRRAQAMTRFPDFWMVSFLAKMPALIWKNENILPA